MQNKGLIRLFAILFGLVSLYQLSFTFFANKVEDEAKTYAQDNAEKKDDGREIARLEKKYTDSIANKNVVAGYTYNDIRDKEMNLGLDLKGGINAVLQVSVRDILIGLSNDSKNKAFTNALANADKAQADSQDDYIDLFYAEFEKESKGSVKLSDPTIFGNKLLRDKIDFNKTNNEVKPILQEEINVSINTAFDVLRSRIDKFGVVQPNIQRIGTSGRIQVELPGAKDIERVKKLLVSTAKLQFWEVYSNTEVLQYLSIANSKSIEILKQSSEKDNVISEKDSTKTDIDDLLNSDADSTSVANSKMLFNFLIPNQQQLSSTIGFAKVQDTAQVNKLLKNKQITSLIPNNLRHVKFLWDYKPFTPRSNDKEDEEVNTDETQNLVSLYAIKSNRNGEANIEGDVIADASQQFDQTGKPEVSMTMNTRGTKLWSSLTGKNINKFVAIVLDDYVYSAPIIKGKLGSTSSISGGSMTVEEAQDISTVLKAGKLPAPARIIESEIVGPSLGKEAINASMWSFGLAILLVLVWMVLYYGKAGLYANIALLVNILFIFGALASFSAVLTLPGIAGIILTIGMSVDANVIIFERIKEALNSGKGLGVAADEGFSIKGALSAIIDANITTLLTGVILYVFGTGPIKGFALTLMVGILTSLFTAIFITQLLVDNAVAKGTNLTFNTNVSKNWFKNINIQFLKKRKIAYVVSGTLILIGLISIFTIGLKQGVDFKGGRSYTVRFDKSMNANEVASSLKEKFGNAPEVKTYGANNQLKITTVYKIEEKTKEVDELVQKALYDGLKPYFTNLTYENFKPGFEKIGNAQGIMSARKVDPTIADDIKNDALLAVIGSLIVVFLYILLRFRKISFSIGAVAAVFHDVLIVLGIFSLLYKFMPFDMEIGQSFIAAILTVVGYSLNDTVVIFDRIREYAANSKTFTGELVDKALSSTLGRTINTSLTTMLVMLAIFFFGGDSIRGFMFGLIIGVLVGTYSSLFVATPVMFDATKNKEE